MLMLIICDLEVGGLKLLNSCILELKLELNLALPINS
jgi:hypothetical protein